VLRWPAFWLFKGEMRSGWEVCSCGRICAGLVGIPSVGKGLHLGSHDDIENGLEEALALRRPAFGHLQNECAEWVGGVFLGSDSRRACGNSFGREHTSAATMTLKLGLAGQHSCFFRGEVGQIRGAYGEHTSAATTMLTMVLGGLCCYVGQHSGF
jgi:hypothetical protein